MRFDTGVHPKQWHRGAWVVAFLLAALVLLLSHRPSGGRAFAMEPDPAPTTPTTTDASPPPDDALKVPPVEEDMKSDRSAAPAAKKSDLPAPAPLPAKRRRDVRHRRWRGLRIGRGREARGPGRQSSDPAIEQRRGDAGSSASSSQRLLTARSRGPRIARAAQE